MLSLLSTAQEAGKVSGIKPDEVWPVVRNVLKERGLPIDNFDNAKGMLVSGYEEYTASLMKFRVKYKLEYSNEAINVSLADKQTMTTSGWATAVIPTKKADEKLVATMVEKLTQAFANKEEVAKLVKGGASAVPEKATVAEKIANVVAPQSTLIVPNVAGAKLLKYDDDNEYLFQEGLCAVKKNQLWGFIDTLGNWVIEPQYFKWGMYNPVFSSGICLLATKAADGYGNVPVYIDKKGNQLFKTQKFVQASPFTNGIAMVGKETGPGRPTVYSFINAQGVALPATVIPKFKGLSFDFGPYSEGLTRIWDDKLNSYGFIDTKGKWVIAPENKKWEDAGEFADERCPVQNTINYYWGYIDKKGVTKIPFDYPEKPGKFYSGRALVKNTKLQMGYLDVNGNMALDFNYMFPSFDFHNGFAVVTLDDGKITTAIIDVNGKVVKLLNHGTDVVVNSDGTVVYEPKGEEGITVLNADGSVIIPLAAYIDIKAFGNNLAYARFFKGSEHFSGFINRKGELVILRKD